MKRTRRLVQLPTYADARGSLLPVELEDVGFRVRRVFVVSAPSGGADRGGHLVPCHELVVLVGGRAELHIGPASDDLPETVVLDQPGAAVHLEPGEHMAYRLADHMSSVLVLADQPYSADRGWL